jgi:hypothetical protein
MNVENSIVRGPLTLRCVLRKLLFEKLKRLINQNYWVFGLSSSSGFLGNRKHDVSETGSVFVLRCGGKNTYSAGSLF